MTKLSAAASEQELLKLGITTQKEPVGASGIWGQNLMSCAI